jgi:hypothetical protein
MSETIENADSYYVDGCKESSGFQNEALNPHEMNHSSSESFSSLQFSQLLFTSFSESVTAGLEYSFDSDSCRRQLVEQSPSTPTGNIPPRMRGTRNGFVGTPHPRGKNAVQIPAGFPASPCTSIGLSPRRDGERPPRSPSTRTAAAAGGILRRSCIRSSLPIVLISPSTNTGRLVSSSAAKSRRRVYFDLPDETSARSFVEEGSIQLSDNNCNDPDNQDLEHMSFHFQSDQERSYRLGWPLLDSIYGRMQSNDADYDYEYDDVLLPVDERDAFSDCEGGTEDFDSRVNDSGSFSEESDCNNFESSLNQEQSSRKDHSFPFLNHKTKTQGGPQTPNIDTRAMHQSFPFVSLKTQDELLTPNLAHDSFLCVGTINTESPTGIMELMEFTKVDAV